jgi:hypothetical protein
VYFILLYFSEQSEMVGRGGGGCLLGEIITPKVTFTWLTGFFETEGY